MIERTVKYPPILAPVYTPPLTSEEFAKDKSTVTMVFEKPVTLTISHGTKVKYTKGVHEVPIEHADHWYLVANGVERYNRPMAVTEPKVQGKKK